LPHCALPVRSVAMDEAVIGRLAAVAARLDRQVSSATSSAPIGVSLGVSIGLDNLLVHAAGVADSSTGAPVTAQTTFYLASVTKTITSTAVMCLVADGLIDLDQPIERYLPAPGDRRARSSALTVHLGSSDDVTVRRVANHTAGLAAYDQYWFLDEPERPPAPDQAIEARGHIVTIPGERFWYANFGFALLQHAVEHTSGMPFATFLEERIFRPLAMKHSWFQSGHEHAQFAAARHRADGTPYPPITNDILGAGSVYSCATDLLLFGQAHLGLVRGWLAPDVLAEAHRPTVQLPPWDLDDGGGCAVGWFVDDDRFPVPAIGHDGGSLGASTALIILPEIQAVVTVLTNREERDQVDPQAVADDLVAALLPEYAATVQLRRSNSWRRSTDPPNEPLPHGRWVGMVSTPDRVRSVEISIDAHSAQVSVDGSPWAALFDPQCDGPWMQISAELTIDNHETRRIGRHFLDFDLCRRGDRLTGVMAAKGGDHRISYWTELEEVQ
jgi:CubicO group peptidase (beta-lactamase class C family)